MSADTTEKEATGTTGNPTNPPLSGPTPAKASLSPRSSQTAAGFSAAALPFSQVRRAGSYLLGMSVRAWLATLLVSTVCWMCINAVEVPAALWSILGGVVTYFFTGPKTETPAPQPPKA